MRGSDMGAKCGASAVKLPPPDKIEMDVRMSERNPLRRTTTQKNKNLRNFEISIKYAHYE